MSNIEFLIIGAIAATFFWIVLFIYFAHRGSWLTGNKKVFCKNCGGYRWIGYDAVNCSILNYDYPQVAAFCNKDNDCRYYHRKWWKVWVR